MDWDSNSFNGIGEESAGDLIGAALGGTASAASSPAWYSTAGGWASDAAQGIGGFLSRNAGGLLAAYTADRNADAAQAIASRNAASGLGVPVRAASAGGIDRRLLIGGGLAVVVLAVVWLARRK